MKEKILKLIAEARAILEQSRADDQAIVDIEHYSHGLQLLLEEQGGLVSERIAPFAAEVRELEELHRRVIEKSHSLVGETSEQLRGLKRKAKGLRAYTDALPKQIRSIRPREG